MLIGHPWAGKPHEFTCVVCHQLGIASDANTKTHQDCRPAFVQNRARLKNDMRRFRRARLNGKRI